MKLRKFILALALAATVTPTLAAIEMPPKKYDHEPTIPWTVSTNQSPASYGAPEPFGCGSIKSRSVACTFVFGRRCFTFVKAGKQQERKMAEIIRHERGHCNGWRH